MAQHESAHEDSEDRFYAQFDSREVELMTLDELQAAFEAGRIHENTFVCREGESEWCTLADVAGLGEEEEEAEPAPVLETRPPMPSRRPDPTVLETRPPMPSHRPEPAAPVAAGTRPPMPSRRPEMNTVPAQRFQQAALVQVQPSTGLSYAPVTSNIDLSSLDMDDELAMRPKRRWGLVLAAAAVLALGGGGAVFALNGGSKALASAAPNSGTLEAAGSRSQGSLSAPSIETKPSEPAAPPAPEPVAAVAPAAPAADTNDAPKAAAPAFTDDMKAALLASDKTRTDKHAKKVKGNTKASAKIAAPRSGKAAASSGFKSGGSAYDPLNGKL
ncbi:MAG: GYF domain-containing protein [Polyangiaceae bacterium]